MGGRAGEQRGPGASNSSKRASKACGSTTGCTAGALCHWGRSAGVGGSRGNGGQAPESAVPEEAWRAFTAAHAVFPARLLPSHTRRGAVSAQLPSQVQALCGHRSGL